MSEITESERLKAAEKIKGAAKLLELYLEKESVKLIDKALQLSREVFEDLGLDWKYADKKLKTDLALVGEAAAYLRSGSELIQIEDCVVEATVEIEEGLRKIKSRK